MACRWLKFSFLASKARLETKQSDPRTISNDVRVGNPRLTSQQYFQILTAGLRRKIPKRPLGVVEINVRSKTYSNIKSVKSGQSWTVQFWTFEHWTLWTKNVQNKKAAVISDSPFFDEHFKKKIFVLAQKLTFLSQQNQEHVLAGPKNWKTLLSP